MTSQRIDQQAPSEPSELFSRDYNLWVLGLAGAAMWQADAAFGALPDTADKALLLSIIPLLLEGAR
ncbi:MAG: hypothetical protein QOH66_2504 [Actinomycetota bacterium]|nr:hypothetical protein [Actinomycetota bacterium]